MMPERSFVGLVAPMFETTLTIPTRQLGEFTKRMRQAGYTVLDTGSRITTDDGPDGEATVRLMHAPIVETAVSEANEDQDALLRVEIVDPSQCDLGVSA